jgi:hypothetical protein
MSNDNKGSGAFNTGPLDAGPEQGGSNMGGLGATGAMDRERDPAAEGFTQPKSTARDRAIIDENSADETERVSADGGS